MFCLTQIVNTLLNWQNQMLFEQIKVFSRSLCLFSNHKMNRYYTTTYFNDSCFFFILPVINMYDRNRDAVCKIVWFQNISTFVPTTKYIYTQINVSNRYRLIPTSDLTMCRCNHIGVSYNNIYKCNLCWMRIRFGEVFVLEIVYKLKHKTKLPERIVSKI